MHNYLLVISYKGYVFKGSQIQKDLPTAQKLIQDKLAIIFDKPIKVRPCSRLDALVHAYEWGVNFRVEECKLTPSRLKYSLNRLLDETMYIKDVIEVGEDFDSRYDAKEKTYLYIVNLNELDPIRSDLEYTPLFKPDIKVLEETLNLYVGKHDFSSFTSEKDDDPIKTIKSFSLDITSSNRIEIRIKGTSFLRYQVRFMVGAALEVASYRLDKIELINRLNGTTKSVLKYKAPAKALYLEKVEYDFKRCENVKS